MHRFEHIKIMVVIVAFLITSLSSVVNAQSVYEKKDSWPETMLATRANFQKKGSPLFPKLDWHFSQKEWKAKNLADTFAPDEGVDIKEQKGVWRRTPEITDGSVYKMKKVPGQVIYFYREFECYRDNVEELEATIGTDCSMAVWFNREKILENEVQKHRGDAKTMKQKLILKPVKGKNIILVKTLGGGSRSFIFSVKPVTTQAIIDQIAADYPEEMGLIMDNSCFREINQWIADPNSDPLLSKMCGSAIKTLQTHKDLTARYEPLKSANTDQNRAKLLALCVEAADVHMQFTRINNEWEQVSNTSALRRAITDLTSTYPNEYARGKKYLEQLTAYEAELPSIKTGLDAKDPSALEKYKAYLAFRRKALLDNPAIDFDEILLVRRTKEGKSGLPQNWQGNTSTDYRLDNEIASLRIKDDRPAIKTVYKPEQKVFVGDVDLHYNADKMLFSSIDENGRWQIFEIGIDGKNMRQVTLGEADDIDNYDPLYLPDGHIIFDSTSGYHGVPCVSGKDYVANLHIMDNDGKNVRRLTFDQDNSWCPVMLSNGRVMYLRWEYTDSAHYFSRLLMHMNPDGTSQTEYYGSNSYWPNALFYARPFPGSSSKFVGIVGGHHGVARFGEMVLFDVAKGRFEADGVIQRIPGYGQKVEPIIKDGLVGGSWPQFIHPFPINDKYFLVSAQTDQNKRFTGIYLVDIFDNMLLIKDEPGKLLLEPVPLKKTPVPPVIPDRVNLADKESTVFIQDIYAGKGLRGVPHGQVKSLRVFQYEYAYRNVGGHYKIGYEGPWDVRRIIGTVPVFEDGSTIFKIPADTPVAVQPLDADGKALTIMRSWFVGMPGEFVSCVGCHEDQNKIPPAKRAIAANKAPMIPEPWHGSKRGFCFVREIQPVLDQYCVGCHSGDKAKEKKIPDFSYSEDYVTIPGANKYSTSYLNLHPYVRRNGPEGDYHMLTPLEFHANTSPLIQKLEKGHHNVKLSDEAWDRLITWIDINVPFYGTWSEAMETSLNTKGIERRYELKKLYANVDEDIETVENPYKPVEFVKPAPEVKRETRPVNVPGWPFDAAAKQQKTETAILKLADSIEIKMVHIPAGEFVLGSLEGEQDEMPLTRTKIDKPFWMAACEISNEQYAQFDAGHDSGVYDMRYKDQVDRGYYVNQPDKPVIRVTWERAMEFCKWLSDKTGKKVTLPTEAQWEWACRAGTATPMWFGEKDVDFSEFANMADVTTKKLAVKGVNPQPIPDATPEQTYLPAIFSSDDKVLHLATPATYKPNPWGLYDMHGNVCEWTQSTYKTYPYSDTDERNNLDPSVKKVVRGGSWRDRPCSSTSSFRLGYPAWQKVFNVGFRIIVEDNLEVASTK